MTGEVMANTAMAPSVIKITVQGTSLTI